MFNLSQSIEYHSAKTSSADCKASILLPSWNNLEMLKLCIEAVRKNSSFNHQIIVHVNEGSDGTAEWIKSQNLDYTYSDKNVGVCFAVNAMRSLASTDYLIYLNDDMYVCPEWDKHLFDAVEKVAHNRFYISGTMIEPQETGNPCAIAPHDFGRTVETFKEQELLDQYKSYSFTDFTGSTWPPFVVHSSIWDLIGGFSTEFSPGLYSDPDFSMKLWQIGVRHYQGVSDSRVYHFLSKSTGRVKRNDGRTQFLQKWGVSANRFRMEILQQGKPFKGPLPDVEIQPNIKEKIRKHLK